VSGAQTSGTVSIGLLAQVFPAAMVDAAIGRADAKELRNRALPARLMVYFVIAMWLWSTSGYVRVLRQLLAGPRSTVSGSRCRMTGRSLKGIRGRGCGFEPPKRGRNCR
jgi:hypothetical protein